METEMEYHTDYLSNLEPIYLSRFFRFYNPSTLIWCRLIAIK